MAACFVTRESPQGTLVELVSGDAVMQSPSGTRKPLTVGVAVATNR